MGFKPFSTLGMSSTILALQASVCGNVVGPSSSTQVHPGHPSVLPYFLTSCFRIYTRRCSGGNSTTLAGRSGTSSLSSPIKAAVTSQGSPLNSLQPSTIHWSAGDNLLIPVPLLTPLSVITSNEPVRPWWPMYLPTLQLSDSFSDLSVVQPFSKRDGWLSPCLSGSPVLRCLSVTTLPVSIQQISHMSGHPRQNWICVTEGLTYNFSSKEDLSTLTCLFTSLQACSARPFSA